MGSETGFILRFPGNLDPRAEEFRPTNTNPIHLQPAATVFTQPTCFPYPCPYTSTVPVAVGVPYPSPAPAAAYVTPPPPPPPPYLSTSPTRSLLLSPLPSEPVIISESSLRRELEVFGDVRGVQMEGLCNGNVTVHFYDIRHAETALTAIQGQHMSHQARIRNYYASLFKTRNPSPPPPLPPPARGLIAGRAVWAQYVFPACNAIPDGQNQGTIVIFNLDSEVSAENVRELFEAFGPVKELRDTPYKKNQRFVEFYDIRDAAKALKHMNGKEISGKVVFIEFSRGGSYGRKSFHSAASSNYKPNFNLNNNVHVPPHFQRRRFVTDQPQLCVNNKSSFNYKGSPKKIITNCGGSSIEEAIGSMNLSGEVGNGVEEQQQQHSQGPSRRKHSNCESTIESTKLQQQQQLHRSSGSGSSSKHWKGKQGKKHETRFLIKEDAIVESGSRDSRTTVMIKNIPNKYSQKLLLNMLDNHCIHCNEQIGDGDDQPLSSYDFVYLPIDFNNKCNVGYGFVNMTSPEATLRLYKAFHLQHWEVFNSRKICEVTYARVQGLEALKEHFKNSKFPCETEHYMPVVFCPPRDGRELTEPLAIVGNKHQTIPIPIPIGISNSDENEMDGGDNNRVGASASASASDDVLSSQSGGVSVEEGGTSELTYDDTDREVSV